MKIKVIDLINLIYEKKAPKKIKYDDYTLVLETGEETKYRFEDKSGCSLSLDYYIEHNKLDYEFEILDDTTMNNLVKRKNKAEDTPKGIEK